MKTFCVFADYSTRRYQDVEAASPEEAYAIAAAQSECWQDCFEHEGSGDYRLSREVQDTDSGEFITVGEIDHCTTCGSEIVETVNESHFGDGECSGCEYERYRSGLGAPTSTQPTATQSDTPPDGPWTQDRWDAARHDSRWAADRWAAGMRDRCRRYPTLHAEEKIRLAMDILHDVDDTWDHDSLIHYPPTMPSFEEYLAAIGSNLYEIRWRRPDRSRSAPDGDAA